MRLIGIDPGLRHTGWGVIEFDGSRLALVASGVVGSLTSDDLASRLVSLYDGLAQVIGVWRPGEAAVEETVMNVNGSASLKLGHARGAVILAAARAGLPVAEYAAKRVKCSLTGTGAATKDQVATMVGHLLPGAVSRSRDATDALAVAICHAHSRGTAQRVAAALGARA